MADANAEGAGSAEHEKRKSVMLKNQLNGFKGKQARRSLAPGKKKGRSSIVGARSKQEGRSSIVGGNKPPTGDSSVVELASSTQERERLNTIGSEGAAEEDREGHRHELNVLELRRVRAPSPGEERLSQITKKKSK